MKLGDKTIDASLVGKRDAFHCPAVVVTSCDTLSGGKYVTFTNSALTRVVSTLDYDEIDEDDYNDKSVLKIRTTSHGIVDPFIEGSIYPETPILVLIRPELVMSLVHHFDVNLSIDDTRTNYMEEGGWCTRNCP